MRSRLTTGTVALGFAAMMIACGGSDDRREEQQAQDRMASAPQQVTVTGCVQPGNLQTDYILENVRTDRQANQQRSNENETRDPARPDDPEMTQWAFVQLRPEKPDELEQHLGREVRVTGTMTHIADDVVGTAGGNHQAPSGDHSMAGSTDLSAAEKKRAEAGPIAQETTVAGGAPILRIESLEPTGQQCTERYSPGGPSK